MPNLVFTLIGVDKLSKTFTAAGRASVSLEGKMSKLQKVGIAIGGPVAIAALKFGKDSVKAYSEAEEAQKKLAFAFQKFPALSDTNQAALQALNSALQKKTRFDDDAIASGQAQLAQFKLTGSQIKSVTPLLLDYAARTGKDVPDAARDVGKALLGNAKALKNVGIFYKSTGNATQDYANITALMREKVGGFAEQEGKTAAGRVAILKNQFGELQETVGSKLLPALSVLITIALKMVDGISHLGVVTHALGGAFSDVVGFADKFRVPLLVIAGIITALLIPHFVALGIAAITSGAQTAAVWFLLKADAIKAAVAHSLAVGRMVIGWAVMSAKALFHAARVAASWLIALGPIGIVIAVVGLLTVVIVKNWDKIKAWTVKTWHAVSEAVSGAVRAVVGAVVGAARAVGGFGKMIYDGILTGVRAIGGFAKSVFDKGRELFEGFKRGVFAVAKGFGDWFMRAPVTKVLFPFVHVGIWLIKHGEGLITGFKTGVVNVVKTIGTWLGKNVVTPVTGAFTNAGKWLYQRGRGIIVGLTTGVIAYLRFLGGIGVWAYRNVAKPIIDRFTNAGQWLVQKGRAILNGLVGGVIAVVRGIGGLGTWVYRNVISPFVVTPFRDAGRWLANAGRSVLNGLIGGTVAVLRGIGGMGAWLYRNVVKPIWDRFVGANVWLAQEGRDLINGLFSGVVAKMKGIGGWVKSNIVDPVVGAVKKFFGIKSPSRVFEGIGHMMIAGLLKGLSSGNGTAIANKVFGSMPKALASLVNKGLVAIGDLPPKALDALSSIPGFFLGAQRAVIPGNVLKNFGRRVKYQGQYLDMSTYVALKRAEAMIGGLFRITQGSYSTRVAASGGTHAGGGVFDSNQDGTTWSRAVAALRAVGFAAWHRLPSQGPWNHHIHAVQGGNPNLSQPAYNQWRDYVNGGDGLGALNLGNRRRGTAPTGYAKGAWNIPYDHMAYIHRREMVVPAAPAEWIRRMGGNTTVTLVIPPGGSGLEQLFFSWLKERVRSKGGNVQKVLGT